GTSVAAIAASKGAYGPGGFAPDANLVVVRVLDDSGSGYASDWAAGLEWVYQNLGSQPVQVANMSLQTTLLHDAPCDADPQVPAFAMMAATVAQANAAGMSTFACSGNAGSATQTAMPGCTTGVITVGATYSRDLGPQPWSGMYSDHFGASFANCADAKTGPD